MDMYDFVSYQTPEIKHIIDNLQFIRQIDDIDNVADDGESMFISALSSNAQRFGATDYKDHRKDTDKQLIDKVLPSIKRSHQRLHFYDSNARPVKTCIIKGYLGGYTGWFAYDNSKTGTGRKTN